MKGITKLVCLFGLVLIIGSCGKETLEGTYTFSKITENNNVAGYEYVNGNEVEIPSQDIDLSLFDGVEMVSHLDDITFMDNNRVSYLAFDRFNNTGSRVEEADYTIDEGILSFDYFDEFGNDQVLRFRMTGETLELDMYAYSYSWGGFQQALEKYDENPNFVLSGEQALQRLGNEEGDKSHVLIYKQIYEMK